MHKTHEPLTVPSCYEHGAGELLREHLRKSREAFGMTQRTFANELGVSVSAYTKYEQGYTEPSIWKAHKMCTDIDLMYRRLEHSVLLNKIIRRFMELPEEKKDEVLAYCERILEGGDTE